MSTNKTFGAVCVWGWCIVIYVCDGNILRTLRKHFRSFRYTYVNGHTISTNNIHTQTQTALSLNSVISESSSVLWRNPNIIAFIYKLYSYMTPLEWLASEHYSQLDISLKTVASLQLGEIANSQNVRPRADTAHRAMKAPIDVCGIRQIWNILNLLWLLDKKYCSILREACSLPYAMSYCHMYLHVNSSPPRAQKSRFHVTIPRSHFEPPHAPNNWLMRLLFWH